MIQMGSRRYFRNHTAVRAVLIDLRQHLVGQDFAPVRNHGGGGFITTGFDAKNTHELISFFNRGTNSILSLELIHVVAKAEWEGHKRFKERTQISLGGGRFVALKIGTRASPLALAQAHETRDLLAAAHPELAEPDALEIVALTTTGDKVQDRALSEVGGKGVFTKELDEAMFDGRIDIAVHSMKDVPTWLPDGMVLPCMLAREDVRDVMVSPRYTSFADMPEGSVVGTTSLRRQAQVLARHPSLKVVIFRGNVQTRLRKLEEGEADATLLAMAGLNRLDRTDVVAAVLEPEDLLPAVGQGAIGITCRADDTDTITTIAALDHGDTSICVNAERAMLDVLDGSCRTPIAGLATLEDGGEVMHLRGLVAEADGSRIWTAERRGNITDADAMGRDAGAELRKEVGEDFFIRLAD